MRKFAIKQLLRQLICKKQLKAILVYKNKNRAENQPYFYQYRKEYYDRNKENSKHSLACYGRKPSTNVDGVVDSYLVAQVGIVAHIRGFRSHNIITIYQAIFIALGASSASVIARSLGKGDVKATNRDTWDAIIITLALSLILGLLSILVVGAILNLLGTEQSVTQAGSLYLALVGGGVVF